MNPHSPNLTILPLALLASLLLAVAQAQSTTYTTDTVLTGDASLGVTSIVNNATLTIQSGNIVTSQIYPSTRTSGSGFLVVNGGTLHTGGNTVEIYPDYGSVGMLQINGGTVTANNVRLRGPGTSILHLTNGNLLTNGCQIGDWPGSPVFARVDGGVWNNSGSIMIGDLGPGQMLVTGGTVNTIWLTVGRWTYASDYTQTGGNVNISGAFYFGYQFNRPVSATLSGGVLTADVSLVGYNGASGVITLKPGGVLATGQAQLYSLNAGIYFEGGTLRAIRNEANWMAGFVAGGLVLKADGGIVDTQNYNIGVGAPFTGTGKLTKTGAGTLTLSGANAHTGGTLVAAGTLALEGSVTMGTGPVTVNPGAVLTTGAGNFGVASLDGTGIVQPGLGGNLSVGSTGVSSTFAGSVSGAGAFSKAGAGTLALTGNCTHTGDTYVTGGTLSLETGGEINTPANGIIVASTGNGAFVMNGGSAAVDAVIIGHDGGTATVTLNGGTLTTREIARWSVPSTISFNGGILRAAGNSSVLLNGFTNGSAVIQAGGLTIDTNGYTVSTVAELTGSGPFTKTGAGTLSLDGTFAHTGPTTVNAGTLSVASPRFANTAGISITPGASLHLGFSGVDVISSLTLNGTTYNSGTWGAVGSGAPNETALITGPGRLALGDDLSIWLAGNGLTLADLSSDGDHDGLTNLEEYFSGSHPGQPNPSTTAASYPPGVIEITFDRRKGLQTVTAAVEWSADLSTWSSDGVSVPQVIADQGPTERLRVTVPRPEAAQRRFVRVRFELPSP